MTKLLHARHNEEVSEHLFVSGKYYDWVITTAFYSALHYLENDLFELDLGGRIYPTFDNYYNSLPDSKHCKHTEKCKLAFRVMQIDCANAYKQLCDMSKTARYFKYRSGIEKATIARQNLIIVKEHCDQSAKNSTHSLTL